MDSVCIFGGLSMADGVPQVYTRSLNDVLSVNLSRNGGMPWMCPCRHRLHFTSLAASRLLHGKPDGRAALVQRRNERSQTAVVRTHKDTRQYWTTLDFTRKM
eukprot:Plantae.Rhodophyta-Rhodochaete_pulchella.ctg25114.p2 GENE.Plantae.Rhodophyta-Rhodochaete_pulchella.ctg25114~~Plantae.Rhodophyta-Rhodochaete_pulchella.ctg25114.p2  ORF type:complete len:102 (+),score=1.96 Plantae.Rhodophyta-Rhodochaete_pulchella.ctg25114:1209-1514(+)